MLTSGKIEIGRQIKQEAISVLHIENCYHVEAHKIDYEQEVPRQFVYSNPRALHSEAPMPLQSRRGAEQRGIP